MDETGLIKLDNGLTNALQVFPNCVLGTGKKVHNKLLSLYETSTITGYTDDPATATSFYGFGVNASTLRYQAGSSNFKLPQVLLWRNTRT